ncbi:hypothetical protein F5Y12DRAFT_792572 [Xylaria sp. FL1777]|nr:hypothetical protein F5Y12DRAFT_792572 [Xylaria sp. FL1777]
MYFKDALDIMRPAGKIIVNTTFPAALEQQDSDIPRVMSAELIVNLKTYLESLVVNLNNITSFTDLQKLTLAFPLEYYPEQDTTIYNNTIRAHSFSSIPKMPPVTKIHAWKAVWPPTAEENASIEASVRQLRGKNNSGSGGNSGNFGFNEKGEIVGPVKNPNTEVEDGMEGQQ